MSNKSQNQFTCDDKNNQRSRSQKQSSQQVGSQNQNRRGRDDQNRWNTGNQLMQASNTSYSHNMQEGSTNRNMSESERGAVATGKSKNKM